MLHFANNDISSYSYRRPFAVRVRHMSKICAFSPMSIARAVAGGLVLVIFMLACISQRAESAPVDDSGSGGPAAMQLAAKIAAADAGRLQDKTELLIGYKKAYGKIDKVPARWPVLVRRALICLQVNDQVCVLSSMEAIDNIGGVNTFPLNHLFEVSRFGMLPETIRGHLRDAETSPVNTEKPASKTGVERPAPVAAPAPLPIADPAPVVSRQSSPDVDS